MAEGYIANKGWDTPRDTSPSEGMAVNETVEQPLENYHAEDLIGMYENITRDILAMVERRNRVSMAINQKMDGLGTTFSNINGHYDEVMTIAQKEFYRG